MTDFLPLFFVPYGSMVQEVILVDVVDGANDVMPNGPLRGSSFLFRRRRQTGKKSQLGKRVTLVRGGCVLYNITRYGPNRPAADMENWIFG